MRKISQAAHMLFTIFLPLDGLGRVISEDFLSKALAKGIYILFQVGKWLDYIQTTLNVQQKVVSANKIVVFL